MAGDMSVDFGQRMQGDMVNGAEKLMTSAGRAVWKKFKESLSPEKQKETEQVVNELTNNKSLQLREGSVDIYQGTEPTDIGIRFNGENYGTLHVADDGITVNIGDKENVELDNINRLVDDPSTTKGQIIDESKMLNDNSVTKNLEGMEKNGASAKEMGENLRGEALKQGREGSVNAKELLQTKEPGTSLVERFNNMRTKASIEIPENMKDLGNRAKELNQNIRQGISNPFAERAEKQKEFSNLQNEAKSLKREINELQRIHPEDKSKLMELEGRYEETLSKAQDAYNQIPGRLQSIGQTGKNVGEAVKESGQNLYSTKIESRLNDIQGRLKEMGKNTLEHAQKGWEDFKSDVGQLKEDVSLNLEKAKNGFVSKMEEKSVNFEKNNLIREENMLGKDVQKYNTLIEKAKEGQNDRFAKEWPKELKKHPEYYKDGQLTEKGQQAQKTCFEKNAFSPREQKQLTSLRDGIEKRLNKCQDKINFLSKKGVDVKNHTSLIDKVSKALPGKDQLLKTAQQAINIGKGATTIATGAANPIFTIIKELITKFKEISNKAIEDVGKER